jgi:hypothetical protein
MFYALLSQFLRAETLNKVQKGWFPMSFIQDIPAEELARLVHHYEELLVHDFQRISKTRVAAGWEQAPEEERRLLISATRLALLELSSTYTPDPAKRGYYATPGEAEWGA